MRDRRSVPFQPVRGQATVVADLVPECRPAAVNDRSSVSEVISLETYVFGCLGQAGTAANEADETDCLGEQEPGFSSHR